MRKADHQKDAEIKIQRNLQGWREVLAAALGGYYPVHVPIECLSKQVRGAE